MSTGTKWLIVKVIFSHLGGDFSSQSERIAITKNDNVKARFIHTLFMMIYHTVGALTTKSTVKGRLSYILVNGLSHYIIDSHRKPLWFDQLLHLTIAIISGLVFLKGEK